MGLTLGPHGQGGQDQGHTQRGEEHVLALVVRLSHQLIVQAASKLQVSLDHWFSAVVTGLMMMMMMMPVVSPVTMAMATPVTVVVPVTMVMVVTVVAPVTMVMVTPVTMVTVTTMVATVTVVAVTSVTFVTSDLSRAEHSHNDPQTQGCPHLGNSVTTSIEDGSSPCSGGALRRRPTSHHRSFFHFPFVLSVVLSHLVSFAFISVCIVTPVACLGLCGIVHVMLLVKVVPYLFSRIIPSVYKFRSVVFSLLP